MPRELGILSTLASTALFCTLPNRRGVEPVSSLRYQLEMNGSCARGKTVVPSLAEGSAAKAECIGVISQKC